MSRNFQQISIDSNLVNALCMSVQTMAPNPTSAMVHMTLALWTMHKNYATIENQSIGKFIKQIETVILSAAEGAGGHA